MQVLGSSLLELKARRARMDVQLMALRRRATELEREYARAEESRRRGEVGAIALFEVRDRAAEVESDIDRLEEDAHELDRLLWRAENGDATASVEPTIIASLQTSSDIDRVRAEILDALRDLAEPLARYQHLAERQKSLTGRIRDATGKDNSYATYIDTALFRAGDYDADLEFVVELLKRARVVS